MHTAKRSSPTGAATHWQVITGAPCAGKTAVIEALAGRGHKVVPEVARAFIARRLDRGETLETIKRDIGAFERGILLEKVGIEKRLPCNETTFFDRAMPDSVAYFRLEGLDDSEPLAWSRIRRYQAVFLLDRLDFIKDAVRSENPIAAARLESLLYEAYADLGYSVVRVPVMDIPRRTDFILRHVAAAEPGA